MIELISLLGGGLMRMLPSILALFTAKQDHAHELAMTSLQLQIDKARSDQAIDLVHTQGAIAADSADMAGLLAALQDQGKKSGVPWVDAVSATVRPFLTYWWCLVLYTANKALVLYLAVVANLPLAQLAPLVLTDFDRAVVGSIIGFWFADRALRKLGHG